jgi:GPN-loop GTPase
MPIYGQVVVGPPGSGKTTYCVGMQDYLRQLGRNTWVVNLDPANEVPKSKPKGITNTPTISTSNELPYECLLDVCESVINLSSVMKQLNLGPNGGLVYCMEYLEAHVEEMVEMLQERIQQELEEEISGDVYLLFDLPGQVELYTHGNSISRLLSKLIKVLDMRLVAVQLIDSHYCTEPANFLSAALLGTTTMLKLELPAVSLLSKVDLLSNYGPLPFSLEFFTDCQDLERLLPYLQQQGREEPDLQEDDFQIGDSSSICNGVWDDVDNYVDDPEYQSARSIKMSSPFFRKHERLHKAIADVVGEFGLVSFLPLDISSAESVGRVLARIDKCNGYIFMSQQPTRHGVARNTGDLFQSAIRSEPSNYECIADIQERLAMARVKE